MKAVKLKQVDMNYRVHLQAYANFRVRAEKKAGKNKTRPVYTTFRKFFDYEKEIDKALGQSEDKTFAKLKEFYKRER